METRPISTQGDCIWPADTDLCCAHVPLAKAVAKSSIPTKPAIMAVSSGTPGPNSCMDDATAWTALGESGAECDPVKLNWCSDATCKTAASKLYDDCKADPILGPAADAAKSALEALGCEPTLM